MDASTAHHLNWKLILKENDSPKNKNQTYLDFFFYRLFDQIHIYLLMSQLVVELVPDLYISYLYFNLDVQFKNYPVSDKVEDHFQQC